MNDVPVTGRMVKAKVKSQTRKWMNLIYEGKEVIMSAEDITGPVGDFVEVFLFEDKEGTLSATMKQPLVTADTYDWVYVVGGIEPGVFVDIGLPKDILVSKDDLPEDRKLWPLKGDKLFVTLSHDRRQRLKAVPISEWLIDEERDHATSELRSANVRGNVYLHKEGGAAMITEDGVRGFIHESQANFTPRLGQFVEGRVIEVKEDGTINVTLRDERVVAQGKDAEKVLELLQKRGGEMPFTDKSSPEEIDAAFNLSKAAFKRALGKLMKEGLVKQEPGRTYLVQEKNE
ncbi:CvfB family protein [Alkalicoccus daliensis]|uniref:S1 motif domain-containing protein n=1 Tax=Alkalicoccus daliensis TaxID=745820 RepID=A0A1H0AII3_9BACI|nr:S1-like domain-containing RNA-binding protein [Alkalicoccus daliensis]SDN33171.1 hypothetical protein SAMN04488053_101495 [Alkalicoccus daliensis]